MKLVASEKDIQKAILDWLNSQWLCKAWRNNTGAVVRKYKGKTRFTRFGEPGAADIIGIYKGRFLAVEVKRPGCKPTLAQELWLADMAKLGAIAFVATSVEECVERWEEHTRQAEAIEAARLLIQRSA